MDAPSDLGAQALRRLRDHRQYTGGVNDAHIDDFAKLATLDTVKRIDEARGEVKFSADILAYYAQHAESFLAPTKLHPKAGEAHMESSQLGVVLCVERWNFPYYQLARVAGPQLMAGNVLVVMHAACVPQCLIDFETFLLDAGALVGATTNLFVSYEHSDCVIDDSRSKGVALTSSLSAERKVAARAGQNLKKSTMELGGTDALIVLDDADLDKTITWAVWGRMCNAARICCAAKRFIVLDSIADKFLENLKTALDALKPDPLRHQARQPRVPGRGFRPRGVVLPRQGRGGRHCRGQRFRPRPRRLGVDEGRGPRPAGREPGRYRDGLRQQHQLVRRRHAVRRHQGLELRTRAGPHGHPGVCQQEAGPQRALRGPHLSLRGAV